jgi:hypothetical protein
VILIVSILASVMGLYMGIWIFILYICLEIN